MSWRLWWVPISKYSLYWYFININISITLIFGRIYYFVNFSLIGEVEEVDIRKYVAIYPYLSVYIIGYKHTNLKNNSFLEINNHCVLIGFFCNDIFWPIFLTSKNIYVQNIDGQNIQNKRLRLIKCYIIYYTILFSYIPITDKLISFKDNIRINVNN